MQNDQPSLFTRDDTFFGVCEGLGQDLGIHPNLLRLALIPALFLFPAQTLIGYLAAGVFVFALRLAVPVTPRARGEAKAAGAVTAVTQTPQVKAAEPEFQMAA